MAPARLELPSGARLGVAWSRDVLGEERRERIAAQHPVLRPAAEIAWLGRWPQAAQSRADELSVDLVVLVRNAKTTSSDPVTHEYEDDSGRSERVRFTGAESEIELQFLRRSEKWEVRGEKRSRKKAHAPWSVQTEIGGKKDVVVDAEAQLAELVALALDDGAGFLAGEALWAARDSLRARCAALDVGESRALWSLGREVVPRSAAHSPRGTLARAAAADWESWRRRIEERTAENASAAACGWCSASVGAAEPCPCPDSAALSLLIEFTFGILQPTYWERRGPGPGTPEPPPNPARELRGDRPRDVLPRVDEIRRRLDERPTLDAGEALARFESEHSLPQQEGLQVLVVGDVLDEQLILGLDDDFAWPARELVQRRRADFQRTLERRDLRAELPFAALIERDSDGKSKPKQLQLVRGKKLDAAALQGLLEGALWAEYGAR